MDPIAHPTLAASSHPQNDSDNSAPPLLPSFNLILPSRPNTPWQLDDTTYLESAGLLEESYIQEQGPCDLTWPCGQSTDSIRPLEIISGPSWSHEISDISPVPSRRESLEQRLRGALCQHAHKESKSFLPRDKLNELVVEDSVAETLTECIPELSVNSARQLALTICPGSGRDPLHPSFRRMFAILVMIEQPQEILILVNNNITDHDLPLVKVRNRNAGRSELRRRTEPHKSLECIDKWSSFLVDLFEEYQWTVLSPFFSRGNKGAVRFYPLDDQTILPFIEDSSRDANLEGDDDFQGGHGSVSRVKIHPSHFDFRSIAVCIDCPRILTQPPFIY
jgi:hypothetical protein